MNATSPWVRRHRRWAYAELSMILVGAFIGVRLAAASLWIAGLWFAALVAAWATSHVLRKRYFLRRVREAADD